MDAETLVTLLVVALVMVVLIFLIHAAGAGRRRPQDKTRVKPRRREVA